MEIVIRPEEEKDQPAVEELTREAFWNLNVPGCDEHYLVHILRKHHDFIPEMKMVAEVDGMLAGNIMYTKSFVSDEIGNRADTVTFGPLSVLPGYQRKGVGRALINHTKEIAIQRGANAIIILGYPHYYCRFGFRSSMDFNISDSEGRFPYGLLALELVKGAFDGKEWRLHLSPVYNFDPDDAEIFDRRFCKKEKMSTFTQEEFSIAIRGYLA